MTNKASEREKPNPEECLDRHFAEYKIHAEGLFNLGFAQGYQRGCEAREQSLKQKHERALEEIEKPLRGIGIFLDNDAHSAHVEVANRGKAITDALRILEQAKGGTK